ncbi:DNA processing protein [Stanieria sp. NIES-3757]|nr:DNA processing protein [Stanieria sp. NIES-3757]
MLNEERAYWLAWSQITGVGPILLQRVKQHFGSLQQAWAAPITNFAEIEGFGNKLIATISKSRLQIDPQKLLAEHTLYNSHFWTPADSEYPRLLLEIPSPPSILYYRGQIQPEENQGLTACIGVVGTRYPTEYGKRWTRKISTTLVKHGFTIISGMAAGIDTEAHRACLEAGGRTVAVLGTGVDLVYPASNQQLYQHIQKQGLIISEYSAKTKPDRGNFPARNRIIAGLCRAVIIMEAPIKSGALITANFANDFGRDVYVLPGSLDNEQSLGCLGLLNRGANVILSEDHLLEMLGTIPKFDLKLNQTKTQPTITSNHLQSKQLSLPQLEPELAQIINLMTHEAISFDLLVEQTGLATGTVLASLSQLELMGLITQLPGMRYQRS